MRNFSVVAAFCFALLSACGGSKGTIVGGTGGTPTGPVVSSISVITSLPQIPSNASQAATITAVVKNSSNQALSGVAVSFAADSGVLVVTQGTTDDNGQAMATLSAGGDDQSNRTITVTASATGASGSVPVDVTGTLLSISGPANLVQGGAPGSYVVSLVDSSGIGISGKSVAFTSGLSNAITTSPATTDATGHATVTLAPGTSGSDTLTATSLGISASQSVAISSQNFSFTAPAPDAKVNLGAVQTVSVTWLSGGAPQVGQTINFATTRGNLSAMTATTNGSGIATVTISSATAGPAVITASGTNVSAQVALDFIATTPASVAIQASPATIPVNGHSTISAIVRDAANNLVEGKVVNFTLPSDPTNGSLSVAAATTDAQGRAQTVYNASSTQSASNGVTVSATVQGTSVTGSTTLTVGGQTVFLSLGTGNSITIENDAQYSVTYAVQAIDAGGNAVANVPITLTNISLEYIKGLQVVSGSVWATQVNATCTSEDVNDNGILDTGEDFNGNNKLEPGKVASVVPGSITTDSTGSGLVKIIYPKGYSRYVKVRLKATSTVSETETSTFLDFYLTGAAADYSDITKSPPGPVSPYGVASSCANPN